MEGMKHSELTTEQVFYRFLQKWLLRMLFDSQLAFELWPYLSYVACIASITANSGLKGQSWVVSRMTFATTISRNPVAHQHFTSWFKATFISLQALSWSKQVNLTIVGLTKHWWTKLCLEIKNDFFCNFCMMLNITRSTLCELTWHSWVCHTWTLSPQQSRLCNTSGCNHRNMQIRNYGNKQIHEHGQSGLELTGKSANWGHAKGDKL